jgi:hypothetical protein
MPMVMRRFALATACALALPSPGLAQTGAPPQVHNRTLSAVADGGRQVYRLDAREGDGVAWWPDASFRTGVIELDIRGRDVQGESFVGVAFHGVDATTYEGVYFRPFNFRTDVAARRQRAVQYISHPAHPWQLLRETSPGVYEKPVEPPPDPDGWFRARVHVAAETVTVFVDDAASPALEVKRLTDRAGGWVGLWVGNGSPGDFANLTLTPGSGVPPRRGASTAVAAGVPRAAAAAAAAAPASEAPAAAVVCQGPPAGDATGLSGTYGGSIVSEAGEGSFAACVVLVDRGDAIDVNVGPPNQPLGPARNVRRRGNRLTFEAEAAGEMPTHFAFDVVVDGGRLTGTLIQTRSGQVSKGRVGLTRQ